MSAKENTIECPHCGWTRPNVCPLPRCTAIRTAIKDRNEYLALSVRVGGFDRETDKAMLAMLDKRVAVAESL